MQSTSAQAKPPASAAPRVWVLADDRPGHRTQVIGLAQSLGWAFEVKDLHFTPLNRISNRILGASLMGLDRARSAPLAPPWPDLVIAMGRRSAPVARWIGVQGGGATRLIQLGRKGADSADPFDLSVTCAHFRLRPHPRRLVISVPITQVTARRLEAEAARWHGLFKGPRPHIAVLVGGTTAQHRLNAAVAGKLADDVAAFAREAGGTLHIVTSRRTGAKATAAMRRTVGDQVHIHEWSRDAADNPYLGYLALADVLIVTGESESMLAEAAAAGRTLFIYPIPEKPDTAKRRFGEWILQNAEGAGPFASLSGWLMDRGLVRPPRRLEEMHAALFRAGTANRFGVALKDARRSVLPDTAAIGQGVHAIMQAECAPRTLARPAEGLLARLGFVPPSDSRTFWFQGIDPNDFDGLADFLRLARMRYPRVRPVFAAGRRETTERLRRLHPDVRVVSAPAGAAAAVRMLKRLNPRLIFMLGQGAAYERPVIDAAGRRHVPVLRLAPATAGVAEEPGVECVLPRNLDPARMMERAVPLMQRDLKQRRSEQAGPLHPYRLGMALLRSSVGRKMLDRRYRKIDGLDALAATLGRPKTILCLGNGPSSEDPGLKAIGHDCLFRVNDRWLGRGLLSEPDMVFTGMQSTVARVRGPVFGFQNEAAADRLKLQRLFGLKDPPLRYVAVDELGTFLDQMELTVVPTNGATMLATAVALAPERLIIAGIDLFLDPRGSYPGDRTTANAYTPRHDRDVEVRIIRRALELYQGEVTILGDVLSRTLAGEAGGDIVETGAPALKDATGR